MKISVITVCYNSVATIRDTIESVLAQTYPNIEYIVVDGASTDGTMDIVNGYRDRIATIISEPDKGIYDAMNKGIRLATGDVIGILNSDDFYENSHSIELVAKQFADAPPTEVVFGNVVFVSDSDLQRVVRVYNARRFRPWKLRFGWMPPHPATFVMKTAYDRVGLYALDYRVAADFEMFVRLLLGARLCFKRIDDVLVRMRIGGVSTGGGVRGRIAQNIENVRACRSNGFYTNLPLMLLKMPLKLMELLRRYGPRGRALNDANMVGDPHSHASASHGRE